MLKMFFKKTDGFSLVESMSAIVILTIALLPALGYFGSSVDMVHQVETRSQAMDIAVDTMEYFKMKAKNDWSEINTAATDFSKADNQQKINFLSTYNQNIFADEYNIEVEVSESNIIGNVKDITVNVKWNNDQSQLSLSSLLRGGG